MNVNCAPTEAVGLVGYLPVLEVSETCRSMQKYKDCAHHILQECIGHILALIEKRSVHGFTAVLAGKKKTFFARLGAMTLDTKERVKFFGLRSDRTCGFCRLRQGRSVTRLATRHDSALFDLLMAWATKDVRARDQISQRSKARSKLARHGWQYKRRCRMNEFAENCLVRSNTPVWTCTVCWPHTFRKDAHFQFEFLHLLYGTVDIMCCKSGGGQ